MGAYRLRPPRRLYRSTIMVRYLFKDAGLDSASRPKFAFDSLQDRSCNQVRVI
jgi:hypothetical protein